MQIIESNIKFNSELQTRRTTKYIVLHHADHKTCSVYDVDAWHKNNGWAGIGYHFFITKDGKIYRGRPLNSVGAHARNNNYYSIGICAQGDFTCEQMPEAQKKTIAELLKNLKVEYKSAVIVGHKELVATECPGKYFPLEELKNYDNILKGFEVMQEQNKIYKTLHDVPTHYKPVIEKLVNYGVLHGDGNGNINVSEDMCRVFVILDRLGKITK